MIPFNFEYYRPESAEEAGDLYRQLDDAGKEPLYYAGGTEIVTFCRQQVIRPGALIDLKAIPETKKFESDGDRLNLGSAVTLSVVSDRDEYPLLARVARRVADRTVRNRLTLGGNICGRLPYREIILPLLLAGAEVDLTGPDGSRSIALAELFDKRIRLNSGEMLVSLSVDQDLLKQDGWHKRREYHGPVGYPLSHLVAVRKGDYLTMAVSGLCAFPFRSEKLEQLINEQGLNVQEKVKQSSNLLPGPVRSDEMASNKYREAMWQKDLLQMLGEMEGRQ
ncbi:MAG: FAD binding domain-containing protein [Bacillota bacterium]